MAHKGSGLAARFRKAVQAREEGRRRDDDARERSDADARAARKALFSDLAAFGKDSGFLEVRHDVQGVTLRYGERYLHFEPTGKLDGVRVEFEGAGDEKHRLYREAQLGDQWIWSCTNKRGREDLQRFFDDGLEELLVRALGLPRPDDMPEPPLVSDPGKRRL